MSFGKTLTLNNGVKFPQIGFGTWQSAPGEVERAVTEAIKVGFTHIDCALIYENQNEVAAGIKDANAKREDLFLVSKLWNNSHRPENVEADLDLTLSQLNTSYLDAWLIHWPAVFVAGKTLSPEDPNKKGWKHIDWDAPSITETWKEVVRIYKETKKVRSVGVSNFTVELLEKVINASGFVPAFNQIECHPSLIQPELFKYCKEKGIVITAYSPLGNNITGKPRIIDSSEVQEIAKRLNATPAQVLIAWGAYQDFSVLSKSVTPDRIKSNFQQIELSKADFEEISKVGNATHGRTNYPSQYSGPWPISIFGEEAEKEFKSVW